MIDLAADDAHLQDLRDLPASKNNAQKLQNAGRETNVAERLVQIRGRVPRPCLGVLFGVLF
jgi:hypothetical protein